MLRGRKRGISDGKILGKGFAQRPGSDEAQHRREGRETYTQDAKRMLRWVAEERAEGEGTRLWF